MVTNLCCYPPRLSDILRAAAPGAVTTIGTAAGLVAVMSLFGFLTTLSFAEVLILAAGLGWLAGLWLGGHELNCELRSLLIQVRRWT